VGRGGAQVSGAQGAGEVIPARELVGAEALRRYDDNGDPVYTTYERVLLAMRWFGWCTAERVYEALEVEDDDWTARQNHSKAIQYWVKRGRVAKRHDHDVVEYRLIHPSQWQALAVCTRCSSAVVDGKTMCQRHLDWEREYKARRRAA
jgi:hypothetical protein